MSNIRCPHCEYDIGEALDPCKFPWEDEETREISCPSCHESIWIVAETRIKHFVFRTEDDMDNR